jgi:histidinol-phosphate aminotransferase
LDTGVPNIDPIKQQVRTIPEYTLAALDTEIKLNQNENPYEIPDDLKQEVLEFAANRPWGRYPEFVPDEFLGLLADHIGWKREGMLAGNGSNELIQAIFAVTCEPGAKVLICQPTFTLYKLLGTIHGAELIEVNLRRDDLSFDVEEIVQTIEREQPKVVILNSPNNPTGSNLSLDDWRTICNVAPGLIVADQAYVEFGGDSVVPLLSEFDRLIVLRTFSKAGSLAGLRIGYGACSPNLAEQISKAKLPYNVNFFTIAAATVVLRNQHRFEPVIKQIISERARVSEQLRKIDGVRVYHSTANYLLFETQHDPNEVFDRVYADGVLIRNVSGYPMLERALRVTIGTPEENNRFLASIESMVA